MKQILVITTIILIGLLTACDTRLNETADQRNERIQKEKDEAARRDTLPPYLWDKLETEYITDDFMTTPVGGKACKRLELKWQFHEEYVIKGFDTFPGHWDENIPNVFHVDIKDNPISDSIRVKLIVRQYGVAAQSNVHKTIYYYVDPVGTILNH